MKFLFSPKFLVSTAAFLPFLLSTAWGAPAPPDRKPGPRPIEMRMGLSPLGSSLGYFLDGKDVNHYRDLKAIMGPLEDAPTLKLLREAEDADQWSWGLIVSGAALGVVTALTLEPTKVLGVDVLDRAATGGFWAQFLMVPGALFRFDAEGRKFNAVQRYNALVRKEKLSGMDLHPTLTLSGNVWGLGCTGRF
jgi:hypothetical protein